MTRRARIEALIERLIATLDAMDGDPDLEPGAEAEAEPEEASAQPAELHVLRVPARRIRRAAPPTRAAA